MVSADGRLEVWDFEFSVLDPALTHSVLDRQLTAVTFSKQSSTILTGDDYGAVIMYKLCRGAGHDTGAPVSGLVAPFLGLDQRDPRVLQWKQEQSRKLVDLIASKHISPSAE